MKNKKQKTPKSHLPKYETGGSNFNEFGYNIEGQGQGTSNIYNKKRASNISANQYAQAGTAIAAGGVQAFQGYNDPYANDLQKTRAIQAGADTAKTGVAGAINPLLGAAVGAVTKIGSGIQDNVDRTDENGNIINRNDSKFGEVVGGFASPSNSLIGIYTDPNATTGQKVAGALTGGISDMFTNRHKNQVESNAKAEIDSNKAQQDAYNQQQQQYSQQQSNYNLMYQDYQKRNNQFPNGGMNMQPNAEVEKQENTLNPDGSTTQFNGPSHEGGGVKTSLDPGTMIFSDNLKLGGKTFAKLNKPNMTTKEDKILGNKDANTMSKYTAQLMKQAKNKSSMQLFEAQEALKQSKLESYAKRLGISPKNNQSSLKGSYGAPEDEFKMGGVQQYPEGGLTYPQKQQAYNDSLTLYKSGFNKNIPNWQAEPDFNNAVLRLTDLNNESPKSTDRNSTAFTNDPRYLSQISVPFAKPTPPIAPNNTKKVIKQTYPVYNMPMKGLEYNPDINPQLQQVPRGNTGNKSNITTGPNMSYKSYYDNSGKELRDNRYYFDPKTNNEIIPQEFKRGGKVPKNSEFTIADINANPDEEVIVPGGTVYNPDFTNALGSNPYDKREPLNKFDQNDLNKSTWDNDYLNNPNAPRPKTDETPGNNKFDWKGLGTQAAYFAANNAGNIYDLARSNKTETRNYNRATASLLDPTAAIRDSDQQSRRAEVGIKNASGGNASGYLANRIALASQTTTDKDRIRQQYANVNAGISNQVNQFNTNIANEEILANAKIRANQRNIKQSAIASIGSNSANQMNDVRASNMDKKKVDALIKMYPALSKDPEMLKYMLSYK